jgi:hypothetical protein
MKAEDRQLFKEAMRRIGLDLPRSGSAHTLEEACKARPRSAPIRWSSARASPSAAPAAASPTTTGVRGDRQARSVLQPQLRSAGRGIGAGLERIRAGGHARPQGQLRDRLLDRESRPDGRAHRRQHHRGAGQTLTDREYQRMRDAAWRSCARSASRPAARTCSSRQSRKRPHGGHRDESARLALQRAGLQGHRLPDRQDRRQSWPSATRWTNCATTSRARPRPASSRHRLCGHQNSALRLRESSRRRRHPRHPDEVGRRGHEHRPDLQAVLSRRRCVRWKPGAPGSGPTARTAPFEALTTALKAAAAAARPQSASFRCARRSGAAGRRAGFET